MYLHIDWPSSKANLAFSVHMLKCHAADTPFQLSIGHQNAQARITVDAEIGIRTCFFFACESAARKLATQSGMGGRVPGPAELSWFPWDGRRADVSPVSDEAHHMYN